MSQQDPICIVERVPNRIVHWDPNRIVQRDTNRIVQQDAMLAKHALELAHFVPPRAAVSADLFCLDCFQFQRRIRISTVESPH